MALAHISSGASRSSELTPLKHSLCGLKAVFAFYFQPHEVGECSECDTFCVSTL